MAQRLEEDFLKVCRARLQGRCRRQGYRQLGAALRRAAETGQAGGREKRGLACMGHGQPEPFPGVILSGTCLTCSSDPHPAASAPASHINHRVQEEGQ